MPFCGHEAQPTTPGKSSISKSSIPSDETASTKPIAPCRWQASENARRSLIRPDPVSQCAMNAHFGLTSAIAVSMVSADTDWPCGTVTTVTLAAEGFSELARNSSRVAAFMLIDTARCR